MRWDLFKDAPHNGDLLLLSDDGFANEARKGLEDDLVRQNARITIEKRLKVLINLNLK